MGKDTFATREHEGSTALQERIAVRSGENAGHFLRTVGLIIGREYKNQVTQRSFRIGTIITMVLLALAACVPTAIEYFTSSSLAQTKIAIVNKAGPVAGLSENALTKHLETTLIAILMLVLLSARSYWSTARLLRRSAAPVEEQLVGLIPSALGISCCHPVTPDGPISFLHVYPPACNAVHLHQ